MFLKDLESICLAIFLFLSLFIAGWGFTGHYQNHEGVFIVLFAIDMITLAIASIAGLLDTDSWGPPDY